MSSANETKRNRLVTIHEYNIDLENFVIYLQGAEENPTEGFMEPGVEYRMANRLIKNLDILSGIDSAHPITISMKSCGGHWNEGMAIYDAILSIPNPVSIINYTHARSMSSLILQAANKRVMMPSSYFMIHEGTEEFGGIVRAFHSYSEFSKISRKQMLDIHVDCLYRSEGTMRKGRWSKIRIREWLIDQMKTKEDVYFTAQEAVKLGFADEIFTNWDNVTKYTHEQLERKCP